MKEIKLLSPLKTGIILGIGFMLGSAIMGVTLVVSFLTLSAIVGEIRFP